MIHIKTFINLITISRIFGALSLLWLTPLTALFYVVYVACVFSDVLDGYLARKTNNCTNMGAFLDSAADLVLIAVILIILLPLLPFAPWMFMGVAGVIITRVIALGIGFYKYRTLSLLHTYANKGAGLIMACFPLFYGLFGITIAFSIILFVAGGSALEEFAITIRAKQLNRNIPSLLHVKP